MSGEEVCIIVIPNDLPTEENDHERNTTNNVQHTEEYPCPECEQSLASRLRYHTIPKLKLRDTIWIPTDSNRSFLVICYTELGPQSDGILDELRRAEIGIREGSKVFVIPLSCALGIQKIVDKQKTLPNSTSADAVDEQSHENNLPKTPLSINHGLFYPFLKSIRARLTVHKVLGVIRRQSSFTFDYFFFCILASILACLGLLENNTVVLVWSALLSPLMGPIMGFVIGMRTRDKKLWSAGLKSECYGILIGILTGFIFGLCSTWSETKWGGSDSFPTDEMRSRGDYRRLWFGALVAIASGAAAALSVLGGNFGSLVGVAISASLLPPAVNTGLLFSYSLLSFSRSNIGRHLSKPSNATTFNSLPSFVNCTEFVDNKYVPLYSCDMPQEAAQLAVYSFIITLINIVSICVMAVCILLIKKVAPIVPDDEITQFWHSAESKKIRTLANNEVQSVTGKENGQDLIEAWKIIRDAHQDP
ncbi:unnamed protein product [Adineta ricciae]|uniref:Uncharacterized protein n=1 Tax=Adineta ricciae TaxID=249248 RepID=A0A814X8Z4_ADIRI|nr:unnamed protein product [Adineta ricciae]